MCRNRLPGSLAFFCLLKSSRNEPCCHTGLYALLALRPRPLWQAESKSHSPGRAQDLHKGMSFQPTKLAQRSRQSRRMADFFFPAFGPNKLFSPASTLKVYENKTLIQTSRRTEPFLPHYNQTPGLASNSTIARWPHLLHIGSHRILFYFTWTLEFWP